MREITENPEMVVQVWERGEQIVCRFHGRLLELMPLEAHIKVDGAKGADRTKTTHTDTDEPSVAFVCGAPEIHGVDPTAPAILIQISARMLAPIIRELQRLGAA